MRKHINWLSGYPFPNERRPSFPIIAVQFVTVPLILHQEKQHCVMLVLESLWSLSIVRVLLRRSVYCRFSTSQKH